MRLQADPSSVTADTTSGGASSRSWDDGVATGDEPSGEPGDHPPAAETCRIDLSLRTAETDPPLVGWLEPRLARIAALEQVTAGCLSVAIVDASQMAVLQRRYKQLEGPTDVLAFDLGGDASNSVDAELVLCHDVAAEQAATRGHAVRLELLLYAVHGLLHVRGYDDDTADGAAAMHRREDELLTAVGLEPAYGGSNR